MIMSGYYTINTLESFVYEGIKKITEAINPEVESYSVEIPSGLLKDTEFQAFAVCYEI